MMSIEECSKMLPPLQDTMPPSFLTSKLTSKTDSNNKTFANGTD